MQFLYNFLIGGIIGVIVYFAVIFLTCHLILKTRDRHESEIKNKRY